MLTSVVFDLDGLLVDSEAQQFEAYRLAFLEFDHELTQAAWTRWHSVEASAGRFVRDEGLDIDAEAVRAVKKRHYDRLIVEELQAKPGAMALVLECAEHFELAVASGSRRESIEGCLEKFGVLSAFAAVCSGVDAPRSKPFPDVYLAALRGLGASPADAVALEDSVTGFRAATAAGLPCIVCPDALTSTPGERFSGAALVVESLEQLSAEYLRAVHADSMPG